MSESTMIIKYTEYTLETNINNICLSVCLAESDVIFKLTVSLDVCITVFWLSFVNMDTYSAYLGVGCLNGRRLLF